MFAPDQYKVRKYPLRVLMDNNFNIELSDESLFYIQQQDNPLFRQVRLLTHDDNKFQKYVIFVDCKGVSDKDAPLREIISNGFTVNGTRYLMSEKSASMTRNSILSFVDEYISERLDERISMGVDVGKTVLSKYYAYRGLMLSSCHCLEGYIPKIIVVPDMKTTIKNQPIKYIYDKQTEITKEDGTTFEWTQKDVATKITDVEIEAFDGCGIHHPQITQEVAQIIERQSLRTVRYPPTTLLLRCPYLKGITHEFNYPEWFHEHGIETIKDIWGVEHSVDDVMIIITKSMYKGFKYFKKTGTYADWEDYWERFRKYDHCLGVAKWNFSRYEENIYSCVNYQILQDLKLDYEDFATLASDSVHWAESLMDGDWFTLCCFLGLFADKHKPINSYCKAIMKNPEMRYEESVRKYVRSLLEKTCDRMKLGRLYLNACYKFLAPDLIMLMEHIGGLEPKGILESDEFFCVSRDGIIKGERAIERNPHICHSEHVVLRGVDKAEAVRWLGHLDDVCFVNCKSITPQRLNGADFDGDLVLVVNDETFISGIDRNAIPVIDVDDKITGDSELDTPENRVRVTLRSMKNMIGEYSNYSTAYHNKKPSSEKVRKRYESYVDIISVLTGKSIDYAKTGVFYSMPRHIAKHGRPLPYFMKYAGRSYKSKKLSKAWSNMNRLCCELESWQKKFKFKSAGKRFNYRIMIDDSIERDEKLEAKIEEVYLRFLKEMKELADFQRMTRNYDKYKEELEGSLSKEAAQNFEINWGWYYRKYQDECAEICPDEKQLANIVVRLCYEKYKSKSRKFIWVVAENGILKNIEQVPIELPVADEDGTYSYFGKSYSMAAVTESDAIGDINTDADMDSREYDYMWED